MQTIFSDQPSVFNEPQFEAYAKRALREAISYYGWDHPVVFGAQQTVMALRRRTTGCV